MQPVVSFLIFSYNQEAFIEEAIRGAFAQDYEPMEIVITDDCSTDSSADVIERIIAAYDGTKTIRFIRHHRNGGLIAAINGAVAAAEGAIYILAAGDDVSLPHRTRRTVEAFESDPSVRCVYSNALVINTDGARQGLHYRNPPPLSYGTQSEKMVRFELTTTTLLGATAAYCRTVFSTFGPLPTEAYYEDRLLSLRAAILGLIRYIDEPLILYRRHGANLWHGILDRITDPLERHEYELNRNQRAVPVLRACIDQAEKGTGLFPEHRRNLDYIIRRMRGVIKRTEVETAMFESRGARRAWIAFRFIATGDVVTRPRQAWGFAKKNLFPRRYFTPLVAQSAAKMAALEKGGDPSI